MVLYLCDICNYKTYNKSNYNRHIKTDKHIMMLPNDKRLILSNSIPNKYKCEVCNREYINKCHLNRHIQKCHVVISNNKNTNLEIENIKLKYENKMKEEIIKEKNKNIEDKEKYIEIIKDKNTTINNNTTNNNNNSINTINNLNNQRITIDFLNKNYNNVITMDEFKKLVDKQKVTRSLADYMEAAFNSKNLHEQSNVIVFYAKDVCKQNQIEMLPLICNDSNLRSYKEKTDEGWKVKINNDNIVYIIDTTYRNTLQQHPDKNFLVDPNIRQSSLPNSIKKRLSNLENIKVEVDKKDKYKDSTLKYYFEKIIKVLIEKEKLELKEILSNIYIDHLLTAKSIYSIENTGEEITEEEVKEVGRYLMCKNVIPHKISELYLLFFPQVENES